MTDIKELECLLNEVSNLLFNDKDNNKKASFNIFNVLKVAENEVIICRLLGELLNPNGQHQLGYKPLELFFRKVLEINDDYEPIESIKNADVVLEDPVSLSNNESDKPRRCDIVIRTDNNIYPIEVKIWAGDQYNQLFDYYRYYFAENDDKNIYYLTPMGHSPSVNSISSKDGNSRLNDKQYKKLSFTKDIYNWIDLLLKANKDTAAINSRIIIEQFKDIIDQMKGTHSNMLHQLNESIIYNEENDNKIDALYFICQNSEKIKKEIQIKYIEKYISFDGFLKYRTDDKNNPKQTCWTNHDRLFLTKNNIYFWINVQNDELYLVSDKEIDGWTSERGYWWTWLKNGKKNVRINDNIKIDITEILNNACQYIKEHENK